MTTPSTDNYTLGRGRLFFAPRNLSSGGNYGSRALGNAPEVSFNMNIEELDHFSSQSGFKAKDKSVVLQVEPAMSFTLDEVEEQNLALLYYANISEVTQAAAVNQTAVIASPEKGRYFDLGSRAVGSTRLAHGTVTNGPFEVGETVTGGTSSATGVVIIVGATYLYVVNVAGGPFVTAEVLTGGTSTATATTTAAPVWSEGIIEVFLTGTPATKYDLGVAEDFTVDGKTGRVFINEDSTIAEGTSITALFDVATVTYKKLTGLAKTKQEGQLRFISDNPEGNNQELTAWRVNIKPDGDTAYIGDDWAAISFVADILKDEENHPESPYMEIIIPAAA